MEVHIWEMKKMKPANTPRREVLVSHISVAYIGLGLCIYVHIYTWVMKSAMTPRGKVLVSHISVSYIGLGLCIHVQTYTWVMKSAMTPRGELLLRLTFFLTNLTSGAESCSSSRGPAFSMRQHTAANTSIRQHTAACGRRRRELCIVAGAWHELELMWTRIYRGLDRYMRRICSMLYLLYLPDTNSNV